MSSNMRTYLVDEAQVKAVPGCNDTELLFDLLGRKGQGLSLAWLDEETADELAESCPGFTHADALRDIFAGRVTQPEAGFVYANAFEHICGSLGEWIHHFHRCPWESLTRLDELFAAHGDGLRFSGGMINNPPVSLPKARDGPWLGHWSGTAVRAAAPAFRAMRAAGPAPDSEPWLERRLDEVEDWIEAVVEQPGSMLVSSYP
jgi:hypothetical protein